MDWLYMLQERSILLTIIGLTMIACLFLSFATWKNKSHLPKSLTIVTTSLCIIIASFSIIAGLFLLNFGFNA